ncbi:hypothetical protein [Bradyrhizobium sp.]|uniref:hypothetical protein n=1 Tax=Bradyrhizobium sp. TaxID=376 RepID=UPI0025C0294E|nr:hypothetical protein [Bradyrhizobium sp.]
MRLDFAEAASNAFAFLSDAGFTLASTSPAVVRYRKGELEAEVFRDPQSYEVGFQIGYGSEKYSTSEIIRLADQRLGDEYRDHTAKNRAELLDALARLADLIKIYAQDEISGNRFVFKALMHRRKAWAENYACEVLASQIRPKAEEAFRNGDYATAASLYGKIESQLSPSEAKKMALAQERSRNLK